MISVSLRYPHFLNKRYLKIIKLDLRDHLKVPFKKVDTVVHLANIANDPSVELNPALSWEVNVLATQKLIENCIKNKEKIVKMFDDKFFRMWEFYLAGCEMAFKWGDQVVYQFQLTKNYRSTPVTRDYIYQ